MRHWKHGRHGMWRNLDVEAKLAEALDISVEQLRAAEESALDSAIQQAVDEGELAPKHAERMRAWLRLRTTIDPETLMAQALDMTPEELQAAWDQGKTPWDLLEEQKLSPFEAMQKLMAAGKAKLDQAVAEGTITQDQADEVLRMRGRGRGPGWMGWRAAPLFMKWGFGRRGFSRRGRHGWSRGFRGWWAGPHGKAGLQRSMTRPPLGRQV